MANRVLLYFITFSASLLGSVALACPDQISSLTTQSLGQGDLCSMYDRYHTALDSMESAGLVPAERVSGLHSPRFINGPTWNREAAEKNYLPWFIYKPAPETWQAWDNGAKIVDKAARKNFLQAQIAPLSFNWLHHVHAASMSTDPRNLPPELKTFRKHGEVGRVLGRAHGLTREQALGLRSVEYQNLFGSIMDTSHSLISWHPTQCLEDRTEEFYKKYVSASNFYFSDWPEISVDLFYKDADGVERQCGYILYSSPLELEHQLNLWLKFVNDSLQAINKKDPATDPLLVAARAQRWLIAIHPYGDGNGRFSRYVMDYILKSLGLPAPLLKDMDEDLYQSEKSWTREIGRGLKQAVAYAEYCAANPKNGQGCNVLKVLPDSRQGAVNDIQK